MKYLILGLSLFFALNLAAQDSVQLRREDELLRVLSNIRKPNARWRDLSDFKKEDYGNRAMQRLLTILANQWTTEELETWVEHDIDMPRYREYRETKARHLAETKKQDYKQLLDSLRSIQVLKIADHYKNNLVDENVIYLVGQLDMQEAVPLLKRALTDPEHYDSATVQLVLARLRVEPYYSNFIKRLYSTEAFNRFRSDPISDYQEKERVALYISTQESVYSLTQWLYRQEKVSPESDEYLYSIAIYPVNTYKNLIKNESFRKQFPSTRFVWITKITREDIDFTRNWMKENKGKLKFNRY